MVLELMTDSLFKRYSEDWCGGHDVLAVSWLWIGCGNPSGMVPKEKMFITYSLMAGRQKYFATGYDSTYRDLAYH